MKKLLIILLLIVGYVFADINIPRIGTKFAYEYNTYGKDGWELVSVMDTNKSYGESNLIIAVFKRKIN